jgi:hypothetical protein
LIYIDDFDTLKKYYLLCKLKEFPITHVKDYFGIYPLDLLVYKKNQQALSEVLKYYSHPSMTNIIPFDSFGASLT